MSIFLSSSSLHLLPSKTQNLTLNLHNDTHLLNSTKKLHFSTPISIFNPKTHFKKTKDQNFTLSAATTPSATQNPNFVSRKRSKKQQHPILSEGRDDDESLGLVCPGCGVFMQDYDTSQPGYYQQKKIDTTIDLFQENDNNGSLDDINDDGLDDIEEDGVELVLDDINDSLDDINDGLDGLDGLDDNEDGLEDKDDIKAESGDFSDEEWEKEVEWGSDFDDDEEEDLKDLDGFMAAGVGYGNITEEVVEKGKKVRVSKAERKKLVREAKKEEKEKEEVTVCARCHSLRNYGQVKNQTAENLIPDFDFDKLISTRLMKATGNADSTVVIMVVDCVDFDGSFPKRAAKSLFEALEGGRDGLQRAKKLPKLVLVATKVDLLPSQVSPTRLDRWVRHRAKANGAPRLNGVYLVSSRKDLGVRNLLTFVKDLAGPRGHVWVIGAQNAGKSTLINALGKKGGVKATKLTEAAVPGTTLGILRIGGILSAKAKMYDTPGLLHPYLMSMRLNREEQKMVEIRKELRPRTYRIKQGQAIHVGGLMRLDLIQASVQTIYVTVWASPNVSLHLGKIENADEIWNKHAGVRLQPPIGEDRVSELGKWESREVKVSGVSWDVNSIDLSVAGLGWFSVGLKGEATLTLWTFDGIEITSREPLVLDRATFLERPGFLLPKAISEALALQSKTQSQNEDVLI